jgi:hypothetical protein
MSNLLFSYGPLRQREVQLATFGRELGGYVDAVIGYELHHVTITDPQVIATSGSDRHPILRPSDRPHGRRLPQDVRATAVRTVRLGLRIRGLAVTGSRDRPM